MSKSTEKIELHAKVPPDLAHKRLDQALALLFPEYSRSRLKTWVEEGAVTVNGKKLRPKDKLLGDESVIIEAELSQQNLEWESENIPLDIIYEEEQLLIVNKPANLVVHPAAGNQKGTLVNALLHYIPALNQLPRAGIVHRLDKDTTGLLCVAKTLTAHHSLIKQLQARTLMREYVAIVWGVMLSGGTVNAPIGRHPKDRKRMSVQENGKEAITHYRVLNRFSSHTYIQVKLETGRTHQIRVHMAHIQYPIVGDKLYGGRLRVPKGASPQLLETLQHFPRQALHAKRLGLNHPVTGEALLFEAPIPKDLQDLLTVLS